MEPRILLALAFAPLLLSPTVLGYNHIEVQSWCSKTPNPGPCEYFLSHNPKNTPITHESDFLKISTELALQRAIHAQVNTYSLGTKCRNEREKTAWADCLELYEYAVLWLNHTTTSKCTKYDAQTWLSTALTNLETCRTGFMELGVSDYVLPLMSNNVSKLISNTLAINNVPYEEPTYKGGFPTWVKPGDRKLLQTTTPASQANIVVAKDGSGNFKTINEAVAAASKRSGSGRFIIYVKAGVYNENVEIGTKLKNLMFVGDGIGKTIVTGSKSVGGGATTFRSATFAVVGEGFIARDMTFRNTAGPENHQAVALRSGADLSVFYKCSFEGYQDTLYVHSQRQFYRECDIYGTVDFIFGNAAVVLQNCNIFARNPPNRTNTLTAQGRTDPNQNTGISIHNSRVTAASDLSPVQSSVRTYLGRPWKEYSRTVFMKTFLDSLINPAGWMEWSGNFALDTLYYGEYMNTGPGSSTANRVTWKGYRVITSAAEASQFTVQNFISGNSWLPGTNVPFTPGL
ncbi:pectinesterase 2 [Ricinus communis]|uniref:Pectinesterase n=1 Tax=Ricinus communis TaxID=3988 RepID=B9RD90_RICCO|nr:pectinesterase 2 [Ricinus communis]EEF50348.1 Pectinesterase-2 precursor, putative [Ricinus communis]|eukprot:XP_002511679.1 pectinesterase 2 [Ricinus communis]